jgi:UDP-glucose:(heptosyl)LPS alpha-1,3-glucosyltransferase
MRIALAIVSYFAGGGLQRDCVQIARRLIAKGNDVTIFASRSDGTHPMDVKMEFLPNRALTNHDRNVRFGHDIRRIAKGRFHRIVGFDKLPGLDILYCADHCQASLMVGALARLSPRKHVLLRLEELCFGRERSTRIILLSENQLHSYLDAWNTPRSRISLVSATLDKHRCKPNLFFDGTRERLRSELGIAPDNWLWLSIGSYPYTKGIDRTIRALKAYAKACLLVVGIDSNSQRGRALRREAQRNGNSDRVRLIGYREDIPALMAAADLFVHPARLETTGTAILESIVNGLPAIVTAACGYSDHVNLAKAGVVLTEQFSEKQFHRALVDASDPATTTRWSENGRRYGAQDELYLGLDDAAEIIMGS